jgi:hypothetical protein
MLVLHLESSLSYVADKKPITSTTITQSPASKKRLKVCHYLRMGDIIAKIRISFNIQAGLAKR